MPTRVCKSLLLAGVGTLFSLVCPATAEEIRVSHAVLTVNEQTKVPASAEGVLIELKGREGKIVEPGELIGRVRDTEAKLALEAAQLNRKNAQRDAENTIKLRLAQKAHALAVNELNRAVRARKRLEAAVPAAEVERKQLAVDKTALEIEQAKYELKTAELAVAAHENEVKLAEEKLRLHQILAPYAGIIAERGHRAGEWVKPGAMVVRVLRLDRLRVQAFLPPAALGKQLDGRPVRLTVDLADRGATAFSGRIIFVNPELNAVNRQVQVWAEIVNRDLLLRPGLKGEMVILDKPAGKAASEKTARKAGKATPDKTADKKTDTKKAVSKKAVREGAARADSVKPR